MKFPYLKFPAEPNEAFPEKKSTLRPVIPIKICNGDDEINTFALVDSGADHNIFDAEIGKAIGIKIKKGKKLKFWGVGSVQHLAYFHKVKLCIGGWYHECYCGFSYELDDLPYQILGQDDFFKAFRVIFDFKKKQMELRAKK